MYTVVYLEEIGGVGACASPFSASPFSSLLSPLCLSLLSLSGSAAIDWGRWNNDAMEGGTTTWVDMKNKVAPWVEPASV